MTETTTEDNVWYLARDGKQHGPLSPLEMTKLVELGHLRATDLVWRPGFTDWRPAPAVFDLAPAAPPASRVASPTATPRPETAKVEPAAMPSPAAPRAQPSFANMSGKPTAPASTAGPAAAPARFEFARAEPLGADASSARAAERSPFDTGPVRSAAAPSQFGVPAATGSEPSLAPALAPEPTLMDTTPEMEAPPRRGRGLPVALGLLLAIGGLSVAGYTYRDAIKARLQDFAASPSPKIPVVSAPVDAGATPANTPPNEPASVVAAASPQSPTVATPAAAPITADTTGAIDRTLQSSPFWSYAKAEFPQWYADRLREVGEMKLANQPESAIDRKLVEQIVVLRRQNASKALAASPARLKEIAEAFVANLAAMQNQSVDACYEYIEKGELTPAAAALVQKPAEGAPLHAQLRAVFAAVVEGQQNPVTRTQPQPTDYNLLAAELGTLGWSQADIQLFADPKALAAAPRDRVCKMVKDWFTAHLAVKDDPARERLLYETLRLVIAG